MDPIVHGANTAWVLTCPALVMLMPPAWRSSTAA